MLELSFTSLAFYKIQNDYTKSILTRQKMLDSLYKKHGEYTCFSVLSIKSGVLSFKGKATVFTANNHATTITLCVEVDVDEHLLPER